MRGLAVILNRGIGQFLNMRFTGREQLDAGRAGLDERLRQESKLGGRRVDADIKASRGRVALFRSALPFSLALAPH